MLEFNVWFFVLLANFLFLIVALNRILFKPLLTLFKERENAISGSHKTAAELNAKKDKAIQDMQSELAAAREKGKEVFTSLKNEGLTKQKELMTAAQDEALKMLDDARTKLRDDADKARVSLREEVENYSDDIAGKLVKV